MSRLTVALYLTSLLVCVMSQTPTVPTAHVAHFDMVFKDADSNSDGKLDRNEFIESFKIYDANGDGIVTKQEYMDFNQLTMPHHMHVVDPMFTWYDTDKDGQLNVQDYQSFFPLMDANGDNQVTELEFDSYWETTFRNEGLI
ncbi:insoluble matrix shell protein 5-like [Physella acuta]|uniref:insoluble matrix shell protein 5-like n=1 Tax=Physella acuta TaxID=109671 RepID=UPI0027DDF8AC|nr:insoluble matrix shell protein 5-like [Physella acuta]